MEIILLEKVRNLGAIGAKVAVKAGYARNYLIPQGKGVRVTKENLERIEKTREQLEMKEKEALNKALERKEAIEKLAAVTISAKSREEGDKLFGSVGTKDIASAITSKGVEVSKSEINLPQGPIRALGEYDITLQLHSDITATIKVKIIPIA